MRHYWRLRCKQTDSRQHTTACGHQGMTRLLHCTWRVAGAVVHHVLLVVWVCSSSRAGLRVRTTPSGVRRFSFRHSRLGMTSRTSRTSGTPMGSSRESNPVLRDGATRQHLMQHHHHDDSLAHLFHRSLHGRLHDAKHGTAHTDHLSCAKGWRRSSCGSHECTSQVDAHRRVWAWQEEATLGGGCECC